MANEVESINPAIRYSHLQVYVDQLDEVKAYKSFEEKLNKFAGKAGELDGKDIEKKQELWKEAGGTIPTEPFEGQNRDLVKQLMAAFGYRVTGSRFVGDTRTVLVTSPDPKGVQVLVTAIDPESRMSEKDELPFFQADKVRKFFKAHNGRQGFAILGFSADNVSEIHDRYKKFHPKMIENYGEFNGVKILQVYAYYHKKEEGKDKAPDEGTIIRFVEAPADVSTCPVPGLTTLEASYPSYSMPAYSDHWVSNVANRMDFMETLRDTLGFGAKVDFNAGVVAAGEAQIESTVVGNDGPMLTKDKALSDQSQIYLPTNNALSADGHVYFFVEELGQGIQHAAFRVENIIGFVQRANDVRNISGEGFSFLSIPRSYYGTITPDQLSGEVGDACAKAIVEALDAGNLLSKDGALSLDIGADELTMLLEKKLGGNLAEYQKKKDVANQIMLKSRYKNMYSLLGDQISEETYMGIVRNQILVDVQGEDLLYQIFSGKIMSRNPSEEGPFFEFIERVCSEQKDADGNPLPIRPGCGGFGIRNFLTLFLSIEVSKAMQEVSDAKEAGDSVRQKFAQQMVDGFTNQLAESNPILTGMSDAMTEEGRCRDKMLAATDPKEKEEWKAKMEAAGKKKEEGGETLKECSARYNALMKSIRHERNKATKGNPLRASLTLPVGV